MKFLLIIPLFFLMAAMPYPVKHSNPVTITGHIKFRNTSVDVRKMLVVVKGDGKKLATANTNSKGDFEITFTPKHETAFKFYCSAPSIGTKLMGVYTSFESDTPEITFFVPMHK